MNYLTDDFSENVEGGEGKTLYFCHDACGCGEWDDGDLRVYKVKHFLSPMVVTVKICAIDIKI